MADESNTEVEYLKESLKNAENELTRKDKLISELVTRLREYEMGEYGLSEAVGEIKECKRVIRVRERELETLTDQLNVSKLQLLDFREKLNALETRTKQEERVVMIPEKIPAISKPRKILSTQPAKKVAVYDKACQCYRSVYPLNCLTEITAIQVQNEKLRAELKTVCEDVMKFLIALKTDYHKDLLKNDDTVCKLKKKLESVKYKTDLPADLPIFEKLKLQDAVKKMDKNINDEGDSFTLIPLTLDVEDPYMVVLRRIEKEDLDVQEIFHELANQIKIMNLNQEILIRRYITMSDREAKLFKDNQELRKVFVTDNDDKIMTICESTTFENQKWEEEISMLLKFYSDETGVCPKDGCVVNRKNVVKLIDLVMRLTDEVTKLKKLLEISRHQSKALESICFDKEVELRAFAEQLLLFQIQSDEKMLLGKLAIKILQLQFSNAAFAYELNKCKLDKMKLEEWYSVLLKGHEDNEYKLCASYNEAYSKVKYLAEILEGVGLCCREATADINLAK